MGLIENSVESDKIIEQQLQMVDRAISRLGHRTIIDIEGWKRVLPISALFQKYNIKIDQTELVYQKCWHPHAATSGQWNFDNALNSGQVVVVIVMKNWFSNRFRRFHCAHSVVLFKADQNDYFIKNSSHMVQPHGGKMLKIAKTLLTYNQFCHGPTRSRFIKNNPNFTDEHLLLFESGFTMEFKQK